MSTRLLKYTTDKLIAVILIILLSPVMLIIITAMWIEGLVNEDSKGTPMYREKRISQGKPFILYKFRTLKMDAINKMTETDSATFLQNNNKNTTRTGKLLIKVYFDEMPQLFNIVAGKMSLVGPRPRIPQVYEEDLRNGYTALQYLRAGITGPHQVTKGKRNCSLERSEEYYRKTMEYGSFKLLVYDLGIMVRTIFTVLQAKGL